MTAVVWAADLRGMVDVAIPLGTWPVMAWALRAGERVSQSISEAAAAYGQANGMDAEYAFLQKMPSGAPEFVEIGNVTVLTADWVPVGFVALARGGTQIIDAEFLRWAKIK
jgi:hypothetical protein